jgi:hypothetical protein
LADARKKNRGPTTRRRTETPEIRERQAIPHEVISLELTNRLGWLRRNRRPVLFLVLVVMLGANILFSRSHSDSVDTGICLAVVVGSALALALLWKGTRAVLRRPCHFTVRQLMICVTVAAVLLAVYSIWVVFLCPRVGRAYDNWRLVNREAFRRRLSVLPVTVTLPTGCDGIELSTGYSSMTIPAEWGSRIRQQETVIQLLCYDGARLVFLTPRVIGPTRDVYVSDIRVAEELRSQLLRDMAADPFSWNLEVLNVGPKGIWSVLAMSDGEWLRYRRQTLDKAFDPDIDNGVGVFNTKHVRGVVRFGHADDPGSMSATLLSTDRPIAQTVRILSPSAEQSRSKLLSLIATYRFISDPPAERAALKTLIRNNLEHDTRFDADDPSNRMKQFELHTNRRQAGGKPQSSDGPGSSDRK